MSISFNFEVVDNNKIASMRNMTISLARKDDVIARDSTCACQINLEYLLNLNVYHNIEISELTALRSIPVNLVIINEWKNSS